MPELPEVETLKRGLAELEGAVIKEVIIRQPQLRWPVTPNLPDALRSHTIRTISRRGKYLLFHTDSGTVIVHLGMSGSMCLVSLERPVRLHDHVDLVFTHNKILRYHDPRRFGAILWTTETPLQHPLLVSIGPEPLELAFSGAYLKKKSQKRRVAIKTFLMDSKIVAGIGNIYAAEALFLAGIHPLTPVNLLAEKEYNTLAAAVKVILNEAILQGGTTLKDFFNSAGKPGYFAQKLHVYGRAGLPCTICQTSLQHIILSQRSTVFCKLCQPAKQ